MFNAYLNICNIDDCISGEATGICPYSDYVYSGWILGITNGYMLMKRVTPFNAQDLKVLSDAISLTGNYFGKMELIMLIIGIIAVVIWVISMWRRGGQYTGKMHRVAALCGLIVSLLGYVVLTDVAIDKRVISNYFGNIAFAYEDYGFPYCFYSECI